MHFFFCFNLKTVQVNWDAVLNKQTFAEDTITLTSSWNSKKTPTTYLSEMGTHLLAFLNTEHGYIISVVRLL